MLRRVHFLITKVASCGRFLTDLMQVLTEASVHGEYLRNPVRQGKPAAVQPNAPDCLDALFPRKEGKILLHIPSDGLLGYVGLGRWCKPYPLKTSPLSASLTVQAPISHGITSGLALC